MSTITRSTWQKFNRWRTSKKGNLYVTLEDGTNVTVFKRYRHGVEVFGICCANSNEEVIFSPQVYATEYEAYRAAKELVASVLNGE